MSLQKRELVQLMEMVYNFCRAWMRRSEFSLPMYLNPKLSTTREKIMGLVVCFQSAGVLGTGLNPKYAKVDFEPVVGNAAGFFEAGHAFSDLEVNPAIRTECAEVVLVDYFVRDTGQREFHILVAGHVGAIVKILDI